MIFYPLEFLDHDQIVGDDVAATFVFKPDQSVKSILILSDGFTKKYLLDQHRNCGEKKLWSKEDLDSSSKHKYLPDFREEKT